MRQRRLLQITTCLLLSLFAGSATGYELSRAEYEALSPELPPWDHDGRLPQGEGRLYELQHIHQELEDRTQRLLVSAFMLQQMERQAPDSAKYRSLRADYATQQQSFARWRESAERRRQAILASTGNSGRRQATGNP